MKTKQEISDNIKDVLRIVKKYDKYGISSGSDDNFIIRPLYDKAEKIGEFFKLAQVFGEKVVYGLYSACDGRQILADGYDEIEIKRTNLISIGDKVGIDHILAKKGGKCSLYDLKGDQIIPPIFQDITDNIHFVCDIHASKQLIPQGQTIPPAQYFIAQGETRVHLFSSKGKKLFSADKIEPAGVDIFIYSDKGKKGIYTAQGGILPADYDDITVIDDIIITNFDGCGEIRMLDLKAIFISFSPIKIISKNPILLKSGDGENETRFNKFGKPVC